MYKQHSIKGMGTASSVANEFISLSKEQNIPLTNMKLVKLMYIAQGLSLSILDRPIFKDDSIEAWKYGPVVPSIYHEFKHFKSDPITSKSMALENEWESPYEPSLTDVEDKKIVKLTWNLYKDTSSKELVTSTHRAGTPWSLTYRYGENRVIEERLIKKYYDEFVVNLRNYLRSA
ncbi:type II toxin-antitoxin system antitoxin SocA domain-containing protein [uncultured Tenacibaculum sp.]|uniref:Panacea domain-containing protein n=1 Tax=uncultured Tenacibaculum sp. TaxID=174713 RepID=UPI00262F1B03|nr:type II toxin-antitoxin system antitoxin SocA domain-containing protein [uncultured Tenacibaculum sp.]